MNALLQTQVEPSSHYWMLWISPNHTQIKQIKQLPQHEQQRVLMLHPKKIDQLCHALEQAITTGNYASITLNREIMPSKQEAALEVLALRNNTHINWITQRSSMNSACQLTLI